jgi:carboxymethylenebutenolidase
MCFTYDAHPPDLPPHFAQHFADHLPPGLAEHGGASSSEDLVLTSQDGTKFNAYIVHPGAPNGAGIVILPDVRGLFQFYKELAERFAVAGVEAIAIDYFGRTAGLTARDESFEYMPHVMQTQPETVAQDVAAAIAQLRGLAHPVRAIFTVGFCFGGANSFHQAANHQGLSGVIGFYGPPTQSRRGGPAPIDRIKDFECPVLGLFGGADQGIPVEDVQQFDKALTEQGVEHEIVIYPDAPHSFFDRHYGQYEDASADAWNKMLAFIGQHTPRTMA